METNLDKDDNKEIEYQKLNAKLSELKGLKFDYFKEGYLVDILDHLKNWGIGEIKERNGDMVKVRHLNWPNRNEEVSQICN